MGAIPGAGVTVKVLTHDLGVALALWKVHLSDWCAPALGAKV